MDFLDAQSKLFNGTRRGCGRKKVKRNGFYPNWIDCLLVACVIQQFNYLHWNLIRSLLTVSNDIFRQFFIEVCRMNVCQFNWIKLLGKLFYRRRVLKTANGRKCQDLEKKWTKQNDTLTHSFTSKLIKSDPLTISKCFACDSWHCLDPTSQN